MPDRYLSGKQYPDAFEQSRQFRQLIARVLSQATMQFGYVANHSLYFYCLVSNLDAFFENFADVIDAMTDASLVESIDLPAESQMTEEEFHLAKSNALEELAQKARDAKAENVHLRQAMYLALGAHYEDQYGLSIRTLEDLTEQDLAVLREFGLSLLSDTIRWAEVSDYVRIYTNTGKRNINERFDELGGIVAETDQSISEMTDSVSHMSEAGKTRASIEFVAIITAIYLLSHMLDDMVQRPVGFVQLLTTDEIFSDMTDVISLAWFTVFTTYIPSFIGLIPRAIRDEFGILY